MRQGFNQRDQLLFLFLLATLFCMKYSLFCFSFLLFLSSKIYGKDHGLFHLSPFQENKDVVTLSYEWQDNEIAFSERIFGKEEIHENYHTLLLEYGRKIDFKWIVSVGMSLRNAKQVNPRALAEGNASYSATGPTEPYIKVHSRRFFPTKDTNLIDIYASYKPSLVEREVGESAKNFNTGRHIFTAGLLYGAEEEFVDWEFQMGIESIYYSNGKEKDLKLKRTRELEDYFDTSAHFGAWYFLSEAWALKGLLKFTVHGNMRADSSYGATTIQRGTSLTKGLSVIHEREDFIYSISFANVRNDYYLRRSSGNLEGNSISNSLLYSVTKSY